MVKQANILVAAAMLVSLAMTGCAPKPNPVNHFVESPANLDKIRNVVLIGLSPDASDSATADRMTEAIYKALQGRKLFHLRKISLTDPACRDLPLNKGEAFNMAELTLMREELKCDYVIFGSVTHFEPHPRMQIGLYVRLLDLREGRLGWGVDHTWDTTDKAVVERIKDFFKDQIRNDYGPSNWRLVTMSPRVFQKFVSYEVANTLPTRLELDRALGIR